jgi:hypothetical protein
MLSAFMLSTEFFYVLLTFMLNVILLGVTFVICSAKCHYPRCLYIKCHIFIVVLNAVMLGIAFSIVVPSIIMLNAIAPSVVMLSVVAPI